MPSPRPWLRRAGATAALTLWSASALIGCRSPTTPTAARVPVAASTDVQTPQDSGAPAIVERVVDGDTVIVILGGREERIRLIGIDTPETKKPDSPIECFGPEASDRLHALLPEGADVRLLRDVEERDDYDRMLAYLFLPTGDFVNLRMVTEGFATVLRIEPNTTFAPDFAAAQAAARRTRIGMWGACPDPGS